jgi:hypothetical protein
MSPNQRRCFHKNVPLPWQQLCSISILLLMAVPPAAASASAAALPADKATEAPALLPRGPRMLQYGVDYRQMNFLGPFGLLAGVNVTRADAQDWESSRSYKLGLNYGLNGHSITLLLEHFDGFAPSGQFFEMPIEHSGIGLYFRL